MHNSFANQIILYCKSDSTIIYDTLEKGNFEENSFRLLKNRCDDCISEGSRIFSKQF